RATYRKPIKTPSATPAATHMPIVFQGLLRTKSVDVSAALSKLCLVASRTESNQRLLSSPSDSPFPCVRLFGSFAGVTGDALIPVGDLESVSFGSFIECS